MTFVTLPLGHLEIYAMHHLVAALTLALQQPAPAQPAAEPDGSLPPWQAPVAAPEAEPEAPPPPAEPPPPDGPVAPFGYLGGADDRPGPAEGPSEAALPEALTHRKLVVAALFNLDFGIDSPVPSGDFTLFLGTNMRPRKNRARTFDWNTALGYQITLSVGGADIGALDRSDVPFDGDGIFIHRHHLTAMGYGGPRQRLYYSFGGGGFFSLAQIVGVEVEGRLGYVFGDTARRTRGIVGGQSRLGLAFEGVPLPQFGVFIGLLAF